MLKRLAILAVVVFLASSVSAHATGGGTENKVDPQPEGCNDNQDSQKTPSVIIQIGSQQPNTTETEEKKDNDRKLTEYTRWLAIFTAVLAVVSIGQGYFLFRQAHHLRTHAGHLHRLSTAAVDSAKTTKETLDAVKNQAIQLERQVAASHDSLRAWIGVDVREVQAPINYLNPLNDLIKHPGGERRFVWEMTNYGQTPAFIKSVTVSNVAYASKDGELRLSSPLLLNDFLGAGKSKEQLLTIGDDALALCELRQMFWRVVVKVEYTDAFDRSHETMVSFHYYVRKSETDPLRQRFYQDVDASTNYNT
jgi:hypothetical protein